MRALRCCFLLVVLQLAARAGTTVSPVTVLVSYDKPHSSVSLKALQQQVQRTLGSTELLISIRDRKSVQVHEQFSELLLFEMKGSCSMDALPIGALSDERGPLAMAYSSDGSILPFGAVECDRVREALQRIVGNGNPHFYQSAYGAALGIVMAHEIYHMLAHTGDHTQRGATKASLSARELLEADLTLPEVARLAIRQGRPVSH